MVSPVRGDYRRCQAETPLIDLFKFAGPALDNATTQALADAGYARAITLAQQVAAYGGIPILWTPIPDGASTGSDAFRLSVVADVKASGYLYADFDSIISNGATPARFKPAYDSGDGTHPNNAGYATMAVEAERVLNTILPQVQ